MNDQIEEQKLITSVSYDQTEILQNILTLYVPSGQFDLDPTYSKGQFYQNGIVPQPTLKYDLNPQVEGVQQADCRNLPLESESIQSIVFDPPFLATTGPSLKSDSNNNLINRRFGVYTNEKELHQMYLESLQEFYRILKPHGILVFKCQDKISSGKQYMSHVFIINEAIQIGFYPKDLFVLLAKSRLVAEWQRKNQKSARKFHSYFLVFEKTDKRIQYC